MLYALRLATTPTQSLMTTKNDFTGHYCLYYLLGRRFWILLQELLMTVWLMFPFKGRPSK